MEKGLFDLRWSYGRETMWFIYIFKICQDNFPEKKTKLYNGITVYLIYAVYINISYVELCCFFLCFFSQFMAFKQY